MNAPLFSAAQPLGQGSDHPLGSLVLVSLVAEELGEIASPEQVDGFFGHVGRRVAEMFPLGDVQDLTGMEVRINGLWRELGLGEARMNVQGNSIVVRHESTRSDLTEIDGPWRPILAAMLRGAYDCWFRQLGSKSNLTTRAEWQGHVIELRHGR